MIHYVLLKFKPGTWTEEIRALADTTFRQLEQEVPSIISAKIYENCYERESNADVMIRLKIDSPEHLTEYLRHPLHVRFAEITTPLRSQPVVSFDRM